jgi:hypothetical protein
MTRRVVAVLDPVLLVPLVQAGLPVLVVPTLRVAHRAMATRSSGPATESRLATIVVLVTAWTS